MKQKTITLLGSTGSIGTQSLEVARHLSYKVFGLTAHTNIDLLEQQVREFSPEYVVVTSPKAFEEAKIRLADTSVKLLCGIEGVCELVQMPQSGLILNSLVGMVGLRPTLAAISSGHDVALANKETLVTGGSLVMQAVADYNVQLLPVDSEHSAIFQCLQGRGPNQLQRIILTASGGPFFGKTKDDLREVTVEQALRHPNWSMGAKITIDSATMMNKGLELIEAAWLFDCAPQNIDVVVHRESVIHSLIEYADHSVIAQLGVPDMKIPIQYALTYPNRYPCEVKTLNLWEYRNLSFFGPDWETFSCMSACKEAIQKGGLYPAIVNGANEQAVELFLQQKITFLQIGELVNRALNEIKADKKEYTVDDIIAIDQMAREFVLSRHC